MRQLRGELEDGVTERLVFWVARTLQHKHDLLEQAWGSEDYENASTPLYEGCGLHDHKDDPCGSNHER